MTKYVICVDNKTNPASLVVGKIYRKLTDLDAAQHDMIRVIDEDNSERDGYLYPASFFRDINSTSTDQTTY